MVPPIHLGAWSMALMLWLPFELLLTLGAHAREGYGSRRVCLSVCLSVCLFVCPSVPALAASASFETSKQRYSWGSLRLFLD